MIKYVNMLFTCIYYYITLCIQTGRCYYYYHRSHSHSLCRRIERLESLLRIGSIPLMASATGLPKMIVVHPSISGESHAEAAARIIASAAVATLSTSSTVAAAELNDTLSSTIGGQKMEGSTAPATTDIERRASAVNAGAKVAKAAAVVSAASKLAENAKSGKNSRIVPADVSGRSKASYDLLSLIPDKGLRVFALPPLC